MTDDKIKAIAQITLVNSSIIGGLSGCVTTMIEQILPMLPDKPCAIALLHELEQIQGQLRDLQPAIELARQEIDSEE